MKKLLALMMALLMVFALSACSDDADVGDEDDQYKKDDTVITEVTMKNGDTFHFTNVDSESVIITKFSSTDDVAHEVVIPSHLDGKAVVAIGQEAFAGCSNISKITFPAPADFVLADPEFVLAKYSMTIASFAFRNCDALTTISIPNYVTQIGESAFYGCISLNEVVFPADSKLDKLAHSIFMECEVLSSIFIPASIRTVGQGAFFGCTALKTVDFAEGTTMIVKQAFQNCKSLEKVILPSSLVTIGSQAFSGTDSLVSVTYNGTSKEVLEYIDTLNLPEAPETPAGVSETEWNAMLDRSNFENVTFSFEGAFVGEEAFDAYVICLDGTAATLNGSAIDESELPIDTLKTQYIGTALGALANFGDFTYNADEQVYVANGVIVYTITVNETEVTITVENTVVTLNADNKLASMTCDMTQEIGGDELSLNVTFTFSDYGTTSVTTEA